MAPEGADHYTCPLGHTRTPFSSAACPYPGYILPSSSSSSSWELFVTLETRQGLPHPSLASQSRPSLPSPPLAYPPQPDKPRGDPPTLISKERQLKIPLAQSEGWAQDP